MTSTSTRRPGRTTPPDASRNRALGLVVGIALLVVVALVLGFWRPWSSSGDAPAADGPAASSTEILGPHPYLLGEQADGDATFVEFLDFQCPACAGLKPTIDQLQAEYEGEVTFAVRFLPLDGHANAVPAAVTAAAANEQGAFEPMYDLLLENQDQWAALPDPTDVFRGYAEQAGLDLERYDADVASQELLDQVAADRQAAEDLELTSTPSFFVDGQPLQPESTTDLTEALDAAAGR